MVARRPLIGVSRDWSRDAGPDKAVSLSIYSTYSQVVLTADKYEFLFPTSPCSSPQHQAADFKERFMNFSNGNFLIDFQFSVISKTHVSFVEFYNYIEI